MKRLFKSVVPILLVMSLVFTMGIESIGIDNPNIETNTENEEAPKDPPKEEPKQETEEGKEDTGEPKQKEEPKQEEPKGEEPKQEEPTKEEPTKEEEPEKPEEPKQEEPDEEIEEPEEEEEELEEEELDEVPVDQGLEYYPQVLEPSIGLPSSAYQGIKRMGLMAAAGITDTIEVDKTAERTYGCRTFEVSLNITGEPQQAPIDVVLVIDRSGSMNAASGGAQYFPIVAEPNTSSTYYVNVGGTYRAITRHSGNVWRYTVSSGWNSSTTYYVKWDPDGSDSAAGSTSSSSPEGKPFYISGNTRLYHAKKAAINFAAKILGPTGVPGSRVSIVSFAGPTAFGNTGHDGEATTNQGLTNNLASIQTAVNGITANGGTNIQAGFRKAKGVIEGSGNPSSSKVIILFTDGMPNASDKGATLQSHENVTSATIHTNATIEAAQDIIGNGIADVFTVGLFQGMNTAVKNFAVQVLTASQNKGFYDAPTASDLDGIFNAISNQLGYAATNAKVIDEIGEHFNLVLSSLPAGASYDPNTRKITWSPGTIYGPTELKYIVQAKPGFPGGLADTNEFAKLEYTDIHGTPNKEKTFPKPEVNVPANLTVSLSDASIMLGETITLGNYIQPIAGGDGNGTYTYEWRVAGESVVFSTDRDAQVSPEEDISYELTVIDSNGCKAKATMNVTVNEYNGDITITKVVQNPKAEDAGKEFDIFIDGPEGRYVVTLTNGESKTIEKLPMGQYVISEIVPMNYELVGISHSSITLEPEHLAGSTVVTNKPSNDSWFDDEDERKNEFTVGIITVTEALQSVIIPDDIEEVEEDLENDN